MAAAPREAAGDSESLGEAQGKPQSGTYMSDSELLRDTNTDSDESSSSSSASDYSASSSSESDESSSSSSET
ncbi:hypothetical protein TNCT_682351, partial [Trichonephila clavata]